MWTRCSSCQKSHPSVKAELQVFSEGLQGVRGGGQANTQEPRGPYQGGPLRTKPTPLGTKDSSYLHGLVSGLLL